DVVKRPLELGALPGLAGEGHPGVDDRFVAAPPPDAQIAFRGATTVCQADHERAKRPAFSEHHEAREHLLRKLARPDREEFRRRGVRLEDLPVEVGDEEGVRAGFEQIRVPSPFELERRLGGEERLVLRPQLLFCDPQLLEHGREVGGLRHAFGWNGCIIRIAPRTSSWPSRGESSTCTSIGRPRRFTAGRTTAVAWPSPPSTSRIGPRSRSTGRPMSRFRRCLPSASSPRRPHSSKARSFHAFTWRSRSTTTTAAPTLARMLSRKAF